MVTVKICYERDGKSVKGKKVFVSFDGLLRGWAEEYTDSNGDANFDANPGIGKVMVDGRTVYDGKLSGRVVVYI